VLLHWRDAKGERLAAMTAGPANDYTATLPRDPARQAWWVTAVDDRGNRAQTVDQPAPNC